MSHIVRTGTKTNRVFCIVIVLILFGFLTVYGQANELEQDTPSESSIDALYDTAIHSVIWIPGKGSGALIDVQLKLAVTNAHVMGEDTKVYVVLPARNRHGQIIEDRSFYMNPNHRPVLRQLGILTVGRVIARDPRIDLALLELKGVPQTAQDVNHDFAIHDFSYMDENAIVHVFGNPDSLKLWRWTAGLFQGYSERGGLRIGADTYGGNSGGPVLDSRGMLIGIATKSNMRTTTWAVSAHHIGNLLRTLKPRLIVSIDNPTNFTIPYSIKWTKGADWKDFFPIPPHNLHFTWTDIVDTSDGYPKLRFDSVADDGEFTEQVYTVKGYIRNFGVGVVPEGPTYRFDYDPVTRVIDLLE